MGSFILCSEKRADRPFSVDGMTYHLYSFEELCYFLENNLNLLDDDWFGENLFEWLEKELEMYTLANKLRGNLKDKKDIFICVSLLFKESNLYSPQELLVIDKQLVDMHGKTALERKKLRADFLIEAEAYRRAAMIYLELINEKNRFKLTDELEGDIYHNLGVAYARLFLFENAATCFAKAYSLRKDDRSREAYLFSLNYVGEGFSTEDSKMDIDFRVMKKALDKFSEAQESPGSFFARSDLHRADNALGDLKSREKLVKKWVKEFENMN